MSRQLKPRTGPGRETQLIFDRPELQARRHRWVYSTLTLVAWVVWMYLWLPLITILAWYFGVRTFLREVIIPEPGTLFTLVMIYLFVVIVMGALLITWSRYNLSRFGGKDRRRSPESVPDREVEEWFDLAHGTLAKFRSSARLVVEHGDLGEVLSVRVPEPSTRSAQSSAEQPARVPSIDRHSPATATSGA
jgi:biofilm PGA synthesis protein PgaD